MCLYQPEAATTEPVVAIPNLRVNKSEEFNATVTQPHQQTSDITQSTLVPDLNGVVSVDTNNNNNDECADDTIGRNDSASKKRPVFTTSSSTASLLNLSSSSSAAAASTEAAESLTAVKVGKIENEVMNDGCFVKSVDVVDRSLASEDDALIENISFEGVQTIKGTNNHKFIIKVRGEVFIFNPLPPALYSFDPSYQKTIIFEFYIR
jgi:rRNA-processing protein FCF1